MVHCTGRNLSTEGLWQLRQYIAYNNATDHRATGSPHNVLHSSSCMVQAFLSCAINLRLYETQIEYAAIFYCLVYISLINLLLLFL